MQKKKKELVRRNETILVKFMRSSTTLISTLHSNISLPFVSQVNVPVVDVASYY